MPAVDRLGMPLVTSGQFAYVYKLKSVNGGGDFAVRCFRGYLGDRDQRYRAIHEHLQTSPVYYLSEFSYAPEGILVGGNRFPILFMKWIEGPTLDLYIREMLNRPDVLMHLSEEWLRMLSALRTSGMAHGDLQHGNIIVEHGQLRLVDHDGIFVTKMEGWNASEVGHQHYQHPRREAHHFNAQLDRFSALVIYLSLLSLAEKPSLWKEHHDENLLFTKADFINPASSTLFAKIREIGPEHQRLADVLASAATGEPDQVPCLLDLVETKVALPAWMTAPVDLDATTKTREVVITDLPLDRKTIRWIPWQEKMRGSSVPSSVQTGTFQTLFGPAQQAAPPPVVRNPKDIAGNTLFYADEFRRKYFVAWFWGVTLLFNFFGMGLLLGSFVALLCVAVGCVAQGLIRAMDQAWKAKKSPLIASVPTSPALAPPAAPANVTLSWSPNIKRSSVTASGSDPLVGNVVLGIYHHEKCDWVDRISAKNRVNFTTAAEAISHGFKPCQICSPVV
jgi:hypothetical protein